MDRAEESLSVSDIGGQTPADDGRDGRQLEEGKAAYSSDGDAGGKKVAQMTDGDGPDHDDGRRWWTEEEEKRVRRKLDLHIVPWLFLTYLLAFLDRSNIGNANTAGLSKSLHITDDGQYQWLLTIFYISYIVFQFLLICYKFIRPSVFMGTCVLVWGSAAILQAAAFDWSGMMAARWFIGMSEAGFGTGVALYLSFFYPQHEFGSRFAWFVVGSAVASAVAGSVSFGIQSAENRIAIEVWRLIFIVEAAPTIVVGVLLFFFLPDSIATSSFLTERERRVAEARLYRATIDRKDATPAHSNEKHGEGLREKILLAIRSHFDLRNGMDAIYEPTSYINAALLFIFNVGFSAIPVYLPTILSQMGYTRLRAQAFSAPPSAVSFVLAVLVTWVSDKTRMRGIYLTLQASLGITGYFMLAFLSDDHTRYGAVWLVVLGLFPSIPLLYSYLLINSSGESKRGVALIIFATIGQCGPVLGTRLFPASESPYYRKGMFVSAGLLLGALLILWTSMAYFHTLNRRKKARWDKAQREFTGDKDQRPLRFERDLDTTSEEGQQEQHLRRMDMARHREKSMYFFYSL